MKTAQEIQKAIDDCKKARKGDDSLCPLWPNEPICPDCTFESSMKWVLNELYR
jgi:hypothetical protein